MLFDLHKAADHSLLIKNYNKFLLHDILFDTGPLFLYLLGSFDNKNNGKTNLLSLFNYSIDDYHLLLKIIHLFKKNNCNFIITPHILSEIIKHIQSDCKKIYTSPNFCEKIIEQISKFIKPLLKQIKEIHTKKNDLLDHNNFLGKWELADISIDVVNKLKHSCTIILADDKKIKDRYENEKDILILHFSDIRNNAYLFE